MSADTYTPPELSPERKELLKQYYDIVKKYNMCQAEYDALKQFISRNNVGFDDVLAEMQAIADEITQLQYERDIVQHQLHDLQLRENHTIMASQDTQPSAHPAIKEAIKELRGHMAFFVEKFKLQDRTIAKVEERLNAIESRTYTVNPFLTEEVHTSVETTEANCRCQCGQDPGGELGETLEPIPLGESFTVKSYAGNQLLYEPGDAEVEFFDVQ